LSATALELPRAFALVSLSAFGYLSSDEAARRIPAMPDGQRLVALEFVIFRQISPFYNFLQSFAVP